MSAGGKFIRVTVVDYGAGNLLSVSRALNSVGSEVILAESPGAVRDAGHLLLPGVGAFGRGMKELCQRGLTEPILAHAKSGKPFLGICLGMQMMMESSSEFGSHDGLGLIPGTVVEIPNTTSQGQSHKIPHIGWNELVPANKNSWENTLLNGFSAGTCMYFVHSYTAQPTDRTHRLADTDYNGRMISAVIHKDNLYGFQCHPEKSGNVGLDILRNFASLP